MSSPPSSTTDQLNQRERYDLKEYRQQSFRWRLNHGKNPEKGVGYGEATVESRGALIDEYFRWVWEQEDTYTTWVSKEHANDWVAELIASENGNVYKNNSLKALQMLFKYQQHIYDTEPWPAPFRFTEKGSQPRDHLTQAERWKIRDASLSYGSVPNYKSLNPDVRDRWRQYLAQRFEKSKDTVSHIRGESSNAHIAQIPGFTEAKNTSAR